MLGLDVDGDPLVPPLAEAKQMPPQRAHLPTTIYELQPFGRQLGPEICIRFERSPTQRRTQTGVFDYQPPRFIDLLKRIVRATLGHG